uniref:NADH-ubiquinone oxidoreductase chain 2 n=1 Tax=Ichneumonidae sp. MT-2014 TaxID=1560014 RepID=A0A0A0S1N8_9HYME|nr:NADH dehydrogenase subunit 2 [Ichneumonidae sp. MT-2014]
MYMYMIQSNLIIFITPIYFITPLITLSLNSWFSMWMMLELNLMFLIPLLIHYNKFYKETSMKYYIIQTLSSSIFIFFSSLIQLNNFNFMNNNITEMIIMLMNLSLLIKLGSSPFHSWMINILNNLSWYNFLILSIWQKIIPLFLLSYSYNKIIIITSSLFSSMIGCIMGNNQQSLRIILSYSSLIHLSWMMLILIVNELTLMLYFMLYMNLSMSLILMFKNFNIFYINQLNLLKFNKINFFFILNLFSNCSFPPLMGFLLKFISLEIMIEFFNPFLMIFIMLMSLLSLMFYIRIIFTLMLLKSISLKMNNFIKINYLHYFINSTKMFFFLFPLNLWMLNLYLY